MFRTEPNKKKFKIPKGYTMVDMDEELKDRVNLKTLLPVGLKVRIVDDFDPWYIVGMVIDDKSDTAIFVLKSWSKCRNYWVYKSFTWEDLFFKFRLLGEVFRDKDGKIAIVENDNRWNHD